MEGKDWHEIHLTGDRVSYTLHELQCGTSYSFYLVAFNSAGHGNSTEIISAKTDGSGKCKIINSLISLTPDSFKHFIQIPKLRNIRFSMI